jgi:hypothetical protein
MLWCREWRKVVVCEDLLSGRVWLGCRLERAEGGKKKATKDLPTVTGSMPGTGAKWM